ncbi:thiol-disulfide isomerase [Lutibacter profundi]|uniref:Thiol-disulfide isomerase n=1 Tax=Lutibacter profundi TaxID=1622118 RepID=A0A109RPC2_9FLAO|nr:thioredoxin family protein [Lutibacter profundi]AMC11752.1 thiol-disulfide isomerase [Lutibacter profundi]
MTKNIIIILVFLLTITTINAQEWLSDFETAKEIATAKNKNIVLVFQGSDWCAPCIKLDKEIWSTKEFKNYAAANFVLLKVDFPRKNKNKLDPIQQKKNNSLMEKYDKNGFFPYVAVLDKNGNVLGSTGYKKMKPAEYIKLLASF